MSRANQLIRLVNISMKKLLLLAPLLLTGCINQRMTLPPRSAGEQMLITRAADAAALAVHLRLPAGSKAYLKAVNFDGPDAQYALSAIRQSLMEQGNALVEDRAEADVVIEVRVGAMSIDTVSQTIGLPAFRLNEVLLPTSSIGRSQHTGVAKFSFFAYEKSTSRLIAVAADITGMAHVSKLQSDTGVITWIGAGTPAKK